MIWKHQVVLPSSLDTFLANSQCSSCEQKLLYWLSSLLTGHEGSMLNVPSTPSSIQSKGTSM
jgi:hypothetical protein